jgi:hypothetical protein
MNASRVLAGEYAFSIGVIVLQYMRASTNAEKAPLWPSPVAITRASVSWAIMGAVAIFQPEIAATLGAAFLVAQLLGLYQDKLLGAGVTFKVTDLGQDTGTTASKAGKLVSGNAFWGKGTGFVYDLIPINFHRESTNPSPGTTGATGTAQPDTTSPSTTSPNVQQV